MKALILVSLLFGACWAQAGINYSSATPLPPALRQAISNQLNRKCNIQPFMVVESQTLVRDEADENGHTLRHYSTLFAVLSAPNQVYASINVQSAGTRVLSIQSPLCSR